MLELDPENLPRWWRPPSATHHLHRWRVELGLTAIEVLRVIEAEQARHRATPTGPKAFDAVMQAFAAELRAERLEPVADPKKRTQGQPREVSETSLALARIRAQIEAGEL